MSFLAHYNFDSRFHTFAEAYCISKGINEIHELLMCLGSREAQSCLFPYVIIKYNDPEVAVHKVISH